MASKTDDSKTRQSQQVERGYTIRQVTHMQASWSEQERGEDGKFFLQLILDNGVEEYIVQPTSSDIDELLKLFDRSKYTTFDLERKIIIFGNVTVKA